jgi:hypothetical protein
LKSKIKIIELTKSILYNFIKIEAGENQWTAFDGCNIPKEKLEEMCKKAGISHTGHKKLLAAGLLANEFELLNK